MAGSTSDIVGHEPLLAHDAAHRPLGRDDRVVPRARLALDVAAAARPVGALEDPAHASAEVGVLARPRQRLVPVLMRPLDILEAAADPFGLLPVVAPGSSMTGALSPFGIGQGPSPFRASAAALGMSFSSPGWRARILGPGS